LSRIEKLINARQALKDLGSRSGIKPETKQKIDIASKAVENSLYLLQSYMPGPLPGQEDVDLAMFGPAFAKAQRQGGGGA